MDALQQKKEKEKKKAATNKTKRMKQLNKITPAKE